MIELNASAGLMLRFFCGSKSVDETGAELLIRVAVEARAESVNALSLRPEADICTRSSDDRLRLGADGSGRLHSDNVRPRVTRYEQRVVLDSVTSGVGRWQSPRQQQRLAASLQSFDGRPTDPRTPPILNNPQQRAALGYFLHT